MSDTSSEYSQASQCHRASRSRSRSPESPQTPAVATAGNQARQRLRLQLRGTAYLLVGFVAMILFSGSASAWSDAFEIWPVVMADSIDQTYVFKTTSKHPDYADLYVYNDLTSSPPGDILLHRDRTLAQVVAIEPGNEAPPKSQRGFYKIKFLCVCATAQIVPQTYGKGHFDGLQPVNYRTNLDHIRTEKYDSFYFDRDRLLWTDEVDPSKQSIFSRWVACKMNRQDPNDRYNIYSKAIQLFYMPATYTGRLPRECEIIELIRIRSD